MNNNYYRENIYNGPFTPQTTLQQPTTNTISDTETFLNMNIGKRVKIYMSFHDSTEWRDKIFEGTIENVGIDYVLINEISSNPILLQKIYINYIEFLDKTNN